MKSKRYHYDVPEKNNAPSLSVLIPARNRKRELEALVSLIDECTSDRLQFIISDNSDEPLGIVTLNPSSVVVRPEMLLNMTENWNFVLSHAKGKYFTVLGDDDALLPGELDRLAAALEDTEADIVWLKRATYAWPDNKSTGNFYQEARRNQTRLHLDQQRRRVRALDYRSLPIPYHDAVVHSRLVKSHLEANLGSDFFTSRTPDYNAGARILFLAKTQVDYPRTVFVSGASPSSNGKLVWSDPTHPRAMEFTDLNQNPPPGWIPKVEIPVGFFWLHEAVEDALIQLNIPPSTSIGRICFRSIVQSQNPKKQFLAARSIWPNLILSRILGLSLALTKMQLARFRIVDLWRYALIVFRVLLGKSQLFSVKASGVMRDTRAMAHFLETSKILESRHRIIRVRK